MFIYKTTCLINNKIYIGKRVKPWNNYLGSGRLLKDAITKYGKENFIREIVEDDIKDKDILTEREIYWISYFNSTDPEIGYNISPGGHWNGLKGDNHPRKGTHHTEETKEKMSKNHADFKGENHPFFGRHHTEESNRKNSETQKGRKLSEETRLKMSISRKGKECSFNPQGIRKSNSHNKYVGVEKSSSGKKWTARIRCGKKRYFIGTFDTQEEAAIAYNEKAIELFGEEARLNVIKGEENDE